MLRLQQGNRQHKNKRARKQEKEMRLQQPSQHRRYFNMANIFWTMVIALLLPHITSQFCEPLMEDTWAGLTEAIDWSFDFAILCPFRIEGDGCPTDNDGYRVTSFDLYIMCESFLGSDCVIDCPGTHFTVFPQASLTLDGISLVGSQNSAVRVKPNAKFTTYSSTFEDNSNGSGNGGAIDAEPNSDVTVMHSTFKNNHALNGGALYHRGRALVKGSTFVDNVATNGGGGAIFSGSQSETGLIQDEFRGNQASFFGPAVFDGSGAQTAREGNTACGNYLGNTLGSTAPTVVCDGVYLASGGTGQCTPFEFECTLSPTSSLAPSVTPTATPSASPTPQPTPSPTVTPTAPPTRSPTLAPTAAPTVAPTVAPTPQPTPNPTASPTTSPTNLRNTASPTLPP